MENVERDYSLEQENVIEFLKDAKTATVTFSQGRYISKIKKLAEKHPDEVEIIAVNKNSIMAHIPVKAIKINIIEGRELTEEEKEIARERLRSYRESRQDA